MLGSGGRVRVVSASSGDDGEENGGGHASCVSPLPDITSSPVVRYRNRLLWRSLRFERRPLACKIDAVRYDSANEMVILSLLGDVCRGVGLHRTYVKHISGSTLRPARTDTSRYGRPQRNSDFQICASVVYSSYGVGGPPNLR